MSPRIGIRRGERCLARFPTPLEADKSGQHRMRTGRRRAAALLPNCFLEAPTEFVNCGRVPRFIPLRCLSLVFGLVGAWECHTLGGPGPTTDSDSVRLGALVAMEGIMGRLPGGERRCPLDVQVESETDAGTYLRQWLSYQSEPGDRVPAYLLIPKTARGTRVRRFPAVLALHQTHAAGQKVVVGLGQSPDDEYGVELVERGYVVLAPPYTLLANYQPDLRALGWESGTLKAVRNNIRGLDLLSGLPYVRTNGFGSIGHSLGGHNGLFTAAFDPRLRAVVSSCGFDSFRDYYDGDPAVWGPERGWCQTRYMPRLAAYAGRLDQVPFDFGDVLAAIAPRAVFVNAPLQDANFRWRSVDRVVAGVRSRYEAAGVGERLVVVHPDSKHRFPPEVRQSAYAFLDRWVDLGLSK